MKINSLQKEIAELLIFIVEYHTDTDKEVNNYLRHKLYDIAYKTDN